MDVAAAPEPTALADLPDELVKRILQCYSRNGMKTCRLACKRLQRLWWELVESLNIELPTERYDSRRLLLQEVDDLARICSTHGQHITKLIYAAHDEMQPDVAAPAWFVLRRLLPAMPRLRSLRLDAPGESFDFLKVAGCAPSIQSLELTDDSHAITAAELKSLALLSHLTELALDCKEIAASPDVCRSTSERLTGLASLSLSTPWDEAACMPTREQLEALLGPLSGSLTSLCMDGYRYDENGAQLAALSSLTQLRSLKTELHLPEAVQSQLTSLQQLTRLELRPDLACSLMPQLLGSLERLEELELGGGDAEVGITAEAAAALFQHCPRITKLAASNLDCAPEWRGVVLEGSRLRELRLDYAEPTELQPDPLANLPTFPGLERLHVALALNADVGPGHRLLGLMRALRAHAGTLVGVDITQRRGAEYDEAFPPEMPRLQELKLWGMGRRCLASLARCSMPSLARLTLQGGRGSMPTGWPAAVDPDFSWIARLPKLRSVMLCNMRLTEGARRELEGMVGSGVEVEWRDW
jgi:hypothetical protein